ncbi:TPA: hypothetical protein SB681_000970 [Campylobacter jejuni]|nr:hypothetical protein [Campylobacter jejuni]
MQPKSIILFFYGYILFFRRHIGVGQSEIKNLKDLEQALKQVNKKEFTKVWVYRNGFATLLLLK